MGETMGTVLGSETTHPHQHHNHRTDPATGEPHGGMAPAGQLLAGSFIASTVVVQSPAGSTRVLQGAEYSTGVTGLSLRGRLLEGTQLSVSPSGWRNAMNGN
jgi:hypothetical protein